MNGKPNQRKLIILLSLATLFVIALAGTGYWAFESFMAPQKKTIALTPDAVQKSIVAETPAAAKATVRAQRIDPGRPTFKGKVIDAQTQQAVPIFTIRVGYTYTGQTISQPARFGQPKEFHAGQFTMASNNYGATNMAWAVRVDAKGYLPAVSELKYGAGDVNFAIQPGLDVQGVVLDSKNAPVSGAFVAEVAPGLDLSLDLDKLAANNNDAVKSVSGADGQFDLPPQTGPIELIAMTADGFAKLDEDASAAKPVLHIAPWAKISGKLQVSDKQAAKQEIQIFSNTWINATAPYAGSSETVTTDADGGFQFNRVMPGGTEIGRPIKRTMNGVNFGTRLTQTNNVVLTAGQSAIVNLGGVGRPVVGKLVFPAGSSIKDYYINDNIYGETAPPPSALPPQMPDKVKNGSEVGREAWLGLFSLTAAGKKYFAAHPKPVAVSRQYALEISEDGTFRINDVVPGQYNVSFYPSPLRGGANQLNQLNTLFIVPDVPGGGYSDEPVDVGEIKFTSM